jgi:glyoxylase-like metal-dependent hydrolase (beta-lactamase superfamily II)
VCLDADYLGVPQVACAWLLEADGELAFVETATAASVPRFLEVLRARGLHPEAVRYVVITHVHLDHAGGAGALMAACPQATLLAHPRAARHAIDPSRLVASARQVYGDLAFRAMYGEILPIDAARVQALGDGASFALGKRALSVHHTRGHADHHFVVHDPEEGFVYTGDAFGLVYPALQLGGLLGFPSTSPTDFDAPAALASLDRVLALNPRQVGLTHFGAVDQPAALADQLRPWLAASGALVEALAASAKDDAEVRAACAEAVEGWFADALAARGLGGDPAAWAQVTLDRDLNSQGLAVAVARRRAGR